MPDGAVFYDQVWQSFGSLDAQSPAAHHRRRLVIALAKEHAHSARRVLEVGCGPGLLLKELERELPAASISGADVSPAALAAARRRSHESDLFVIDLEDPDFMRTHRERLQTFDLVIACEVLEHLADDLTALERLSALLVAGGQLIITVPGGAKTAFDRAIGHVRHYDRRELAERLRSAGFQVERSFAWGFPFHSAYRLLVRCAARISLRENGAPRAPGRGLELAYRTVSSILKPLYYLNRPHFGAQLFAVARKS